MASPHPFGNPKAPPFIPADLDDLQDVTHRLFLTFPVPFEAGPSSTPMTRSATPKRARTNTSPPPPPVPATDWAAEYKKYRMEAEGLSGAHAGNFNPKPFGVILAKLEKHHTDSISTLVETVRFLLGELTTLKSQVAALDSVVDVVTPAPFSTVLSPAPRRTPAPPAAATKLPAPPPPPPPPAVPIAPLWATVARRSRRGKAVQTAAGLVESFHMNRAPVESYAQFMARRNTGASAPPPPPAAPKRQQTNTTPPLRPRRLLVKRDGSPINKTPMELRDDLNKALGSIAILSIQISRSSGETLETCRLP